MTHKLLLKTVAMGIVPFVCATAALAQYPGPGGMGGGGMPGPTSTTTPTYTPRSYSMNKAAIGALVGAGAGGAFLLMRRHHNHTIVGCVGPEGTTLDDGKKVYSVIGSPLKADEHVEVSGNKTQTDSGGPAVLVKSLRKDFGHCEATASTSAALHRGQHQ